VLRPATNAIDRLKPKRNLMVDVKTERSSSCLDMMGTRGDKSRERTEQKQYEI
jgi:hypothetical protein